ncbi:unnamed protein product [Caretta caretta]
MDCGSRFFYALEKMRGAKKHVTCLLAEDGTPLTDPEEMCERACDFYTSLFSPDLTDPGACGVLWEELPIVSVGDRDRLELPLTLAEFSEALRRMPTNKSPGMDGLTVEFYRAFWDILSPDLVTVWAESLQSGVLPLSCRRAVLAWLPKKGDLRDLLNWRPVSLLSTDYKIVAKAISLRLGRLTGLVLREPELWLVLSAYADDVHLEVQDPGDLARVEACQAIYLAASSARVNWVKSSGLAVGDWRQGTSRWRNAAIEQLEWEVLDLERRLAASPEDQLLFGPCQEKQEELRALENHRARGAFVQSRIRLLREMDRGSRFFYALEKMRGGQETHQEEYFDRVDHGYLLSTLRAFGFRPEFVGFLRVLYTSTECLVKLNWTLTKPVNFGRLTGLVLWEPELRLVLSAYADDVLLMVQDPGDLARVEACQAIYSAASSAQVNWVKSSGLAGSVTVYTKHLMPPCWSSSSPLTGWHTHPYEGALLEGKNGCCLEMPPMISAGRIDKSWSSGT